MELELVMYSIRKLVETQTGAKCYATYPPKDSSCFGSGVGSDYHKFIIFTQVFDYVSAKTNTHNKVYLYYRNKRTTTQGIPEFSSCELGVFTGKVFVSLFKEHIDGKDQKDFAQLVADKMISIMKN